MLTIFLISNCGTIAVILLHILSVTLSDANACGIWSLRSGNLRLCIFRTMYDVINIECMQGENFNVDTDFLTHSRGSFESSYGCFLNNFLISLRCRNQFLSQCIPYTFHFQVLSIHYQSISHLLLIYLQPLINLTPNCCPCICNPVAIPSYQFPERLPEPG